MNYSRLAISPSTSSQSLGCPPLAQAGGSSRAVHHYHNHHLSGHTHIPLWGLCCQNLKRLRDQWMGVLRSVQRGPMLPSGWVAKHACLSNPRGVGANLCLMSKTHGARAVVAVGMSSCCTMLCRWHHHDGISMLSIAWCCSLLSAERQGRRGEEVCISQGWERRKAKSTGQRAQRPVKTLTLLW
jgi:hypothetical protein